MFAWDCMKVSFESFNRNDIHFSTRLLRRTREEKKVLSRVMIRLGLWELIQQCNNRYIVVIKTVTYDIMRLHFRFICFP